jgi:hypothetical protein
MEELLSSVFGIELFLQARFSLAFAVWTQLLKALRHIGNSMMVLVIFSSPLLRDIQILTGLTLGVHQMKVILRILTTDNMLSGQTMTRTDVSTN